MFDAFTLDQALSYVQPDGARKDPRVREFKVEPNPENGFTATIRGSNKAGKIKASDWIEVEASGDTQLVAVKGAYNAFMTEAAARAEADSKDK